MYNNLYNNSEKEFYSLIDKSKIQVLIVNYKHCLAEYPSSTAIRFRIEQLSIWDNLPDLVLENYLLIGIPTEENNMKKLISLEYTILNCLKSFQKYFKLFQLFQSITCLTAAYFTLKEWKKEFHFKYNHQVPFFMLQIESVINKYRNLSLIYFHNYYKENPPLLLKDNNTISSELISLHQLKSCIQTAIICLAKELPTTYNPLGYEFASSEDSALTGIKSFPCIFAYPSSESREHWPNMISLYHIYEEELSKVTEIGVSFTDSKMNLTYNLMRIDSYALLFMISNEDCTFEMTKWYKAFFK